MKGNLSQKNKVVLTDTQRKQAQKIKNDVSVSKTVRDRAMILLLADESVGTITHESIAARVGVKSRTVSNVVRDFCKLGLEETLKFHKPKNPPNPPIVTGEKEARIIATACSKPPEGYAKWSIRLLTDKLVELEIFTEVSRETVRLTLKKLNLNLT